MKVLIVYDSVSGNTEKMAYAAEEGVKNAGVEVVRKRVEEASVDEIPQCQGLIIGSPVYYGLPSAKIKQTPGSTTTSITSATDVHGRKCLGRWQLTEGVRELHQNLRGRGSCRAGGSLHAALPPDRSLFA